MRVAVVALLAVSGCGFADQCSGCPAVFTSFGVRIVDDQNQPVTDMWTMTTHVYSGLVLRRSIGNGNHYTIVVDGDEQKLPPHLGDHDLRFFAQHDSRGTASGNYVLSFTECACGIDVEGPTTLVLQPF